MQTQGDRLNYMSSGYSKELNVQNVSYFMLFSIRGWPAKETLD